MCAFQIICNPVCFSTLKKRTLKFPAIFPGTLAALGWILNRALTYDPICIEKNFGSGEKSVCGLSFIYCVCAIGRFKVLPFLLPTFLFSCEFFTDYWLNKTFPFDRMYLFLFLSHKVIEKSSYRYYYLCRFIIGSVQWHGVWSRGMLEL